MKKLKVRYDSLIKSIKFNLSQLSELEKENCDILDKSSHPFACIMSDVFSYINPSLANFGYNVGRYVFFADAIDDMDDDLKSGNYNIFNTLNKYNGTISAGDKQKISDSILLTLSFIASEYEKLPKFKNKEILDNIIYIGMRSKAQNLIDKIGNKKGHNNDRSV